MHLTQLWDWTLLLPVTQILVAFRKRTLAAETGKRAVVSLAPTTWPAWCQSVYTTHLCSRSQQSWKAGTLVPRVQRRRVRLGGFQGAAQAYRAPQRQIRIHSKAQALSPSQGSLAVTGSCKGGSGSAVLWCLLRGSGPPERHPLTMPVLTTPSLPHSPPL